MKDKITNIAIALALVPNGIKVKLTKISERDDAEVPNNIPVDDYRIGYVNPTYIKPKIGSVYMINSVIQRNEEQLSGMGYFHTSTITEIIDDNTFKTLNSIYKLELL